MRNVKIVADSSANLLTLDKVSFAAAPLKVITDEREFTDDATLDVDGMVDWFDAYKGKSKTSCPNPSDWLEAFGDGDGKRIHGECRTDQENFYKNHAFDVSFV